MGTKSKWLKGKLTFYNNPVVDRNVFHVVGGTTIPSYGMVVITATGNDSYYIKDAPAIGQKLDIVVNTSWVASVFACSTAAQRTFAGPPAIATTNYNGVVSVPGGAVFGELRPCSIQLRGISTSKWAITSCSTQKGGFSLSTAVA